MKIPVHVAVIMDGNGRWAHQRGQEREDGHRHGVDAVRELVQTAAEVGIRYLTLYAFSTENWGRPAQEVDSLMGLLAGTILSELDTLTQRGIEMRFIGERTSLPTALQESIRIAEQTAREQLKKPRLTLIVALNYSARWEITQAVRQIAIEVETGTQLPEQITEQTIATRLTTVGVPDPELLIRTSGEQRLSNFLLWQLSYTELYFTDLLWPEFGREPLLKALEEYTLRERRFGRLNTPTENEPA